METNSGLPGAGAVGDVLTPLQRARLKAYGSRTEVSDSEEERQRYVEAPPPQYRAWLTISVLQAQYAEAPAAFRRAK